MKVDAPEKSHSSGASTCTVERVVPVVDGRLAPSARTNAMLESFPTIDRTLYFRGKERFVFPPAERINFFLRLTSRIVTRGKRHSSRKLLLFLFEWKVEMS